MKQFKFLISLILLVLLINLVSAGNLSSQTYICNQESANKTYSCGGIGTGSYSVYGDLGSIVNPNFIDENYETYAQIENVIGDSIFYVNYTKPYNFINASWTIKYSHAPTLDETILNFQLNNSYCLTNNNLAFRVNKEYLLGATYNSNRTLIQCYNNTKWLNLSVVNDEGYYFYLHEEGINWTFYNIYENNQTFNYNSYSGALETFNLNLSYNANYYTGISANLVYNGTNHTGIISGSRDVIITSTFNVPTITSDTNYSFYWLIALTNSTGTYYFNSQTKNQTLSNTALFYCTGSKPFINFTTIDENLFNEVNTSFKVTFNYFSNEGSIYKNYSYQDLTQTKSKFGFCFIPISSNITVNAEIEYYSNNYNTKTYYLNNATLSNSTSFINLTLSNSSLTQIFYITVTNGVNPLTNAYITVQKYYTGLGQWLTIGIRKTDGNGKFIEYLELNGQYRFIVFKNSLLGMEDKNAICTGTPCEITINVGTVFDNIFQSFEEQYAGNILSNVSFNPTNKIVTYTFIDITGLATYFKLNVYKNYYNSTGNLICSKTIYSTAGTLTCNMSNYTGDFIVKTYISRSPEKIDQIFSFIIGDLMKDNLGVLRYLISMIVIVTMAIVGAVLSRGNPTVVLIMVMIAIDGLKILNILPFSWVVVISLNLLMLWVVSRLKT